MTDENKINNHIETQVAQEIVEEKQKPPTLKVRIHIIYSLLYIQIACL